MWRKWCKVLIYVLFYMSSTKNCHLSIAILTWFVAKTKMATIFGDVTGLQQHHPLWNIPHLVLNIKGFPLKAKSFLNTATYQNLWGGVPSTSGLSLVPRWGYEFASTSEGWVRKEMYKKVCGKRCRYLHRHASTFFDLWQLNRHWNMLSKCNWVSTIQYCLLIPFSDG